MRRKVQVKLNAASRHAPAKSRRPHQRPHQRLHWGSWCFDDFLYPSDNAIVEHHFDAMRMMRRFGQNALNDSFRKRARALVLFFDNADSHAGTNFRSSLASHADVDFFSFPTRKLSFRYRQHATMTHSDYGAVLE